MPFTVAIPDTPDCDSDHIISGVNKVERGHRRMEVAMASVLTL